MPEHFRLLALLVAVVGTLSCATDSSQPPTGPSPPGQPSPPAGPPRPLETVTITITNQGFALDSAAAAMFTTDTLRVYQGSRLTFLNRDTIAHDIQSGPPQIHTDCPEVAGVGFLVPGQAKSTDPLGRLVTCTFHDHIYENDPRFSGRALVEAR
jgi:hypothetical protein